MRHFSDQALCGSNGKPRVRVQGDDVTNPRGHERRLAADRQERGVRGTTKEPVELMQFSALAFPSDPLALALVPDAPTMKYKKTGPIRCRSVSAIEAVDSLNRYTQKLLVACRALG